MGVVARGWNPRTRLHRCTGADGVVLLLTSANAIVRTLHTQTPRLRALRTTHRIIYRHDHLVSHPTATCRVWSVYQNNEAAHPAIACTQRMEATTNSRIT